MFNREIDVQNLKELQDLPEKRREGRAQEIRSGVNFLQRAPRFPANRRCVDLPWAILFLLTVLALIVFSPTSIDDLQKQSAEPAEPRVLAFQGDVDGYEPVQYVDDGFGGSPDPSYDAPISSGDGAPFERDGPNGVENIHLSKSQAKHLILAVSLAGIAGAFGGLISASLWILAAKTCASAVVYTSLYTVPSIIVLVGIVLLVAGSVQGGLICCLVGVLLFTLVMWCWARYIPFTIEVAQMVAAAFSENLEMVAISAFGGLLGPIWVILVVVAYAACELKLTGNLSDGEGKESSDAFYPFFFVCVWGSGVIQNICHVAYCGVFSRWYYEEEGAPLLKSLQVALGTSFGSICQGTLIIAAISTVETAVRSSRRQAQQDGNMVGCVISLVLECFLSCIGDLMEYFNQWVFVLCAICGGTFCDSVKGTCAMISCSGMKAVIGDLLIDRVVMLGSILSAIAGAGLAALAACLAATDAGQQLSKADIIGLCSLLGSLTGLISGGGVMGIMSSGTKAILMCWAEDPDRLHQDHGFEDVHEELSNKAREWK